MKLVTWNTQWCCGLDGVASPERIVAGACALAGEGGFDVLCLQEIADGYPGLQGAPGAQPAELAALLPGYAFFFGPAVEEYGHDAAGGMHCARFGNAIATRLAVSQVERYRLPWPADAAVSSMPRQCTVVTLTDPKLATMRVMTTHLEYYSPRQRLAQAQALRSVHLECAQRSAAPPRGGDPGSPFRAKPQPEHTILCGDFNMEVTDPGYQAILQPDEGNASARLLDAWPLAHGARAHPPTFRLFDRTYGPEPVACDFCFVSGSLAPHVADVQVDTATRVSDHQPVLLVLE